MRRAPKKARYDEAVVHAIIDAVPICHVGALAGPDEVVVLPFLHARVGDVVLLHGSQSNRILRAVCDAERVCVTFTSFDGLRVARTGFHSSVIYRSAVVYGHAALVEGDGARTAALDALVEAIMPGRTREIRAASTTELALTRVVSLSIDEASAKISAGPTEDDDEDVASFVWAGDVPARTVYTDAIAATDGAMRDGSVPVPPSVRALLER